MRALYITALALVGCRAHADEGPRLRVARATAENRARFAAGEDPLVARERWRSNDAALGADAFALFPVGVDASWELVIDDEARLRRLGVTLRDGEAVGLVFVEIGGAWRSGYSCALCHSRAIGDKVRPGPANAALRYGALLADGFPGHPEARRWRSWGPGRADVTDDGIDNPLRIPDLVGLDAATYLQASGAHTVSSREGLAGRIAEVLGRSPVGGALRPTLSVALAEWLRALPPPAPPDARLPGAKIFAQHCAGCHDGPALGGRKLVEAGVVGTDERAARDGLRGTGSYRVPPLLGVGSRARLFHDGAAETIAEVLDPRRRSPGHSWGTTLSADERAAIVSYLSSSRWPLNP